MHYSVHLSRAWGVIPCLILLLGVSGCRGAASPAVAQATLTGAATASPTSEPIQPTPEPALSPEPSLQSTPEPTTQAGDSYPYPAPTEQSGEQTDDDGGYPAPEESPVGPLYPVETPTVPAAINPSPAASQPASVSPEPSETREPVNTAVSQPAATASPTPTQALAPTRTATPSSFFDRSVFGPLLEPLFRLLATHTPTVTPTATSTATITLTPTRTPTRTHLPTSTATPRPTATSTPTPTATFTPAPSETPAPFQPAVLYPLQDYYGATIDWGYTRLTEYGYDNEDRLVRVSAFISLQLMDRAIHRETIQIAGKDLTLYYLNAAHEFGGKAVQVRLVLGGEWGRDVPLDKLTTSGSFIINARVLPRGTGFAPIYIHKGATFSWDKRRPEYQGIFLAELEQTLASLPDELVVLADHPIIVPPEEYAEVEYAFQNIPWLAARFAYLMHHDEKGRVTGPSAQALSVANYLMKSGPAPDGAVTLSSDILILIPNYND